MFDKIRSVSCFLLLFFAFVAPFPLIGQVKMSIPLQLQWKGVVGECYAEDTTLYIGLDSAEYEGDMPVFCQSFPIYDDAVKVDVKCLDVNAIALSQEETQIAQRYACNAEFEVTALPLCSRDKAFLSLRIVPFRQRGNGYEKLLSATLSVTLTPDFSTRKSNPVYATRSVMASGDWYKIGLPETGIYKLTASDLAELGVNVALSEVWAKGGEGGRDLAEEVVRLCEQPNDFSYAYDLNLSIKEKLETIAKRIYHADGIHLPGNVPKQIQQLEDLGFGNLPICMAKTQYSFSDDQTKLGAPKDFKITIRNIKVSAGAGFIVALTGEIMTMPGLPKVPAAEKIDVDENGVITGLF